MKSSPDHTTKPYTGVHTPVKIVGLCLISVIAMIGVVGSIPLVYPHTASAQLPTGLLDSALAEPFNPIADMTQTMSDAIDAVPNTPLVVAITANTPAAKNRILDKIMARLKDTLKVAKDVAYKQSVRIFYQQLANVTTEYIRTAGTGQKPVFITDPNYWQNVWNGAQNNFLDSISTDVFGVSLAAPPAEQQKQIGLLVRGILNPGTVCEDRCMKSYDTQQQRITKIQAILDKVNKDKRELPSGTNILPNCPLAGDVLRNPTISIDGTVTQQIDKNVCVNTIEDLLATERAVSTKGYTNCVRGCRNSRARIQTDPILKEQIGNEAVAAAVMDLYDPKNSAMGQTLSILNKSADKAANAVAQEQTAYNTKIGPSRTVAGLITAPAVLVEQYTKDALSKATNDVDIVTGTSLADTISKAIGNALIQRIVNEWFKSKCGLNPGACKNPTGTSPQARLLFGSSSGAQVSTVQLGKTQIVSGEPSRNTTPTIERLEADGYVDQKFREAVEQGLTVGEALEQGNLDSARMFGFDQSNNQATYGYSYQSILHLVTSRIVPVGWQLAAEYKYAVEQSPLGLGELVEQFDVCGQDADHDDDPTVTRYCTGGRKAVARTLCTTDDECVENEVRYSCIEQYSASPYCGLVDPDWVLKSPLSYCRRQGAGEELLSKTFICDADTNNNGRIDCSSSGLTGGDTGRYDIQRKEDVCVDQPTCVAENEDGSCLSYGYCFEDERTFRFDGTMCPSYYSSCQAYTNVNDESVAYLTKTIDRGGCSADNAGCAPYCADRKDKDRTWMCNVDPTADPVSYVAVACPAGETCTCRNANGESCQVASGADRCDLPSGGTCWLGTNFLRFTAQAEECSSDAEGCRQFINTTNTSTPTNLLANGSFEQNSGIVDDATADEIDGWSAIGVNRRQLVTTSDLNMTQGNSVGVRFPQRGAGAPGGTIKTDIDTGRPLSFQTFTFSYYGKAESGSCASSYGMRSPDLRFNPAPENAVYTPVWTRYSQTATVPDIGYANDPMSQHALEVFVIDSDACAVIIDGAQLEIGAAATDYNDYGTVNATYLNGKRKSCDRVDVGCERYTPKVGGDPITGVVNVQDTCPKEDVGCRQFRKEPITHIPARDAEDPINLVPSSGTKCSASDVGCEEYTNLDTLARGGEAREYFTSIRQCVKPVSGDVGTTGQATFFSWVGDDRSGFQLKSYRLKASNMGNGAPCTNLTIGTSTTDDNPACADTAANQRVCTAADIFTNPDCVQYFNSAGVVTYRLQSQTIPVSDECHPYRNTIDEDLGRNTVYHILASESPACSSTAAMCRAFTGNTGGNVNVVASMNFETTNAIGDWAGFVPDPDPEISSESVNPSGHSLKIVGTTGTQDAVLKDKLKSGMSYVVSLWAKPEAYTGVEWIEAVQFVLNLNTPEARVIPISGPLLTSSWQSFEIGPLTIPAGITITTARLDIRIGNRTDGSSRPGFIDNIQLKEVNDSTYLIDGSFRRCENSSLGCQEYTDRANRPHYLKGFTRLCSADVVGCSALIDTQNSSSPFMSPAIHGVSVPADRMTTAIIEKNALCAADDMGCVALGYPTFDASKNIRSYETVHLKDQPDTHLTTSCGRGDLWCSEYTTVEGAKAYFKDPGAQTCSFKRLAGQRAYRWYITGTSLLCPSVTPPQSGVPVGRACVRTCSSTVDEGGVSSRAGLACVADIDCPSGVCIGNADIVGKSCTTNDDCTNAIAGNACDSWTGLCPEEQSGCTEYRDPTDPNPCRSTCGLETQNGKEVYVDASCNPTICLGGPRDGFFCKVDSDCPGSCTDGVNEGLACTYPSQCPGGTCSRTLCSGEGIPGCKSYFYIKQSVEKNAAECNGRIDPTLGCRPFNDTSDPVLNYRVF